MDEEGIPIMYAQAVRTSLPRRPQGVFRGVFKSVHFQNRKCDCIKYLKVGDPCMGSGHILVYAFDVLMQIYESAGYGQRDAARSILENNLYGLDIDDRAFQMAYFAVMMKARQYNRRILNGEYKPNVYSIQESNGIYRNQLKYFGAGLNDLEKNDAVTQMTGLLDTFKDAKEYGSILTVDQYDWDLLDRFVSNVEIIGQMSMYTVGLDDTAEQMKQIINQGKVLAQKYHVTTTNPPYMASSGMNDKLNSYVKKNYSAGKNDLFAVFMEKCINSSLRCGYIGMITQHSWMFLSRYADLRKEVANTMIVNMAHLGARAFEDIGGEVVQTTSFVLNKTGLKKYKGTYCRLVDENSQDAKEKMFLSGDNRYVAAQYQFMDIPDAPISYHLSDDVYKVFEKNSFLGDVGTARQGLGTSDNNTFLRLWSEVSWNNIGFGLKDCEDTNCSDCKWFPYIKGGSYRRWYPNKEYVVNYSNNGFDIKSAVMRKYPYLNNPDFVVKNTSTYFHAGITWSDVSTGLFSARWVDDGYIYADAGPMFFCTNKPELKLAYMNTPVFQLFGDIICQGIHYSTGQIPQIPYIKIEGMESERRVIKLVGECKALSMKDWDAFEGSWDYKGHYLSGGETMGRLIADKYKEWELECEERFNQLKANEEELNRIFIEIYGLQDELTPEVEDKDVTVRKAELQRDIKSLLSYAVGCMFGRYSLDVDGLAFAGGEWDASKYVSYIPDQDNVIPITDEEYLEDDIVSRLCAWLKVVYGDDTLEQNLDFIARALGNKGDSSRTIIRNYFLNDFFKDHCQTYSVTGSGKRPIYWLFDSGKQNGFKALIYLHRYNADTVGNLRIDYLHRMQRIYESEIGRMQDMIDHSTSGREVAQATKRREKLTKQLKECREYDEKLAHLALSRIELDLDEGVKKNYRKIQTANDGKFYEVLADSKGIMAKEK
ncbi:BREX-1 system adenine-specific DNA-methyltransferase PglX [Chordicoccus furentiruminis]|uniref:BREX-1 system adenine-specific DNA-methyltransferase PglX n=1 Tax=Chordicoccus furentiruminis TaxID=2709410 RepID=UPI0023A8707E|nr:BREX-1 system adenine-specific DNA-methyltransferase PglX [Chordicoccus furentiruminis]